VGQFSWPLTLYVNFDETLLNVNSINEMHEAIILDGYKVLEAIYGENRV